MKVKSFKIYTDDSDEDKVLVGNNIETALEILENNGYIVEAEYESIEDIAKANGIEFDTLSNHKENEDE
jgi:hypothetical protein